MATEKKPGILKDIGAAVRDLFASNKIDDAERLTLEVLFGLLGALARADSIVTSHETDLVNSLMDELDLAIAGRRVAKESFDRGRQNQLDAKTEINRFLVAYPVGTPEVGKLYDALLRLAAADGRIRPREVEFLEVVTIALGFTADTLKARLKIIAPSAL
ncbi:hypothetical protein C7S18_13115 [Ahniella affigens]|uniref:Co-chaperone DjlA N-terminal domain-containing protein n=1 Tax=Ahniella affigens TaxID=2021234 RepID=A0A2P1PTC2_9GAMM|nr:TerB family tellurite resistance protein [Ahniella affigens]AVP98081.1 hypothetical protein C7S18_13115 [Ahniella affigens]